MRNAVEGFYVLKSVKSSLLKKLPVNITIWICHLKLDVQRKQLLKTVRGADDKNNQQNFFRYLERTSL